MVWAELVQDSVTAIKSGDKKSASLFSSSIFKFMDCALRNRSLRIVVSIPESCPSPVPTDSGIVPCESLVELVSLSGPVILPGLSPAWVEELLGP